MRQHDGGILLFSLSSRPLAPLISPSLSLSSSRGIRPLDEAIDQVRVLFSAAVIRPHSAALIIRSCRRVVSLIAIVIKPRFTTTLREARSFSARGGRTSAGE